MLCPATDNPASCKIHSFRFLYTKNMSVVDIHDELCAVYGQNEKCEGVLRQ
jgi:hypothetical protein